MKRFLTILVLLTIGVVPVLAGQRSIPPGLEKKGYTILGVCDCLAVEISTTLRETFPSSGDMNAAGSLFAVGAHSCTDDGTGPGESLLRGAMFFLTLVQPADQDFCRL